MHVTRGAVFGLTGINVTLTGRHLGVDDLGGRLLSPGDLRLVGLHRSVRGPRTAFG